MSYSVHEELEQLQEGKISASFHKMKDGRRVLKITVMENKDHFQQGNVNKQ